MKPRTFLLGILAVQLALGILYTFAIPLWQGHEADYYNVVRFLDENGRLPNAADFPNGDAEIRQATHPPLYFLAAYPFVAAFPHDEQVPPGAQPALICVGANDLNAAYTPYPPTRAYLPPYSGAAAAGYALRLFNVALGMAGVVFTYLAGRALFPSRAAVALVGAALLAFEGNMVRLNSGISNDTLLVTLSALNLWCCTLLVRRFQWRVLALLVVSVALALLTRLGGWALLAFDLPFVLFIALYQARTAARSHARPLLIGVGIFVLLALAVLVFNQVSYGSIFGRYSGLTDSIVYRLSSFRLPLITMESVASLTYESYLEPLRAIQPRAVLELLYGLLIAAAGIGIVWGILWAKRAQRGAFALLFGMFLAAAALVLFRNALAATDANTTSYSTAFIFAPLRYYASGLPALALLLGAGLCALIPARWRALSSVPGVAVAAAWLLVSAVGGVFALRELPPSPIISPADYAALTGLMTIDATQPTDAPTVLAYALNQRPQDGMIDLTLYLTTQQPLPLNHVAAVSITGAPAPCQFVPAHGAYPTTLWQPGEIIAASAAIPVCNVTEAPQDVTLRWLGASADGTIISEQSASLMLAALNADFHTAASCPENLGVLAGGYQVVRFNSPATLRPGETYLPSVNWLVLAPSPEAVARRFSFTHAESGTTYTCDGSTAPVFYDMTRYVRGEEVYFDSCAMHFPAEAPAGSYNVSVSVLNANHRVLPAVSGSGQTLEDGLLPVGSIALVR